MAEEPGGCSYWAVKGQNQTETMPNFDLYVLKNMPFRRGGKSCT